MKRNLDIIRKIMLRIEALPSYDSEIKPNEFDGIDSDAICFHMLLLLDEKLIYGASRLTWKGCDYLDKIRDNSIANELNANANHSQLGSNTNENHSHLEQIITK